MTIKTGDILCTSDGTPHSWFGRLWQLIGYLVPGKIDHIIIYIGPGGRFVEAGARGVIEFEMSGPRWDASQVVELRLLVDTLIGVAYPLQGLKMGPEQEERIRSAVASYCIDHVGKPYNANFLRVATNEAFYCSQLAYLAYREAGVDIGVTPVNLMADSDDKTENTPLLVLPTALLENCEHRLLRNRRWLGAARRTTTRQLKRADSPTL
ncbi:MAG: YiiX/YebB-like N1pC/P60 family cysteine hydrolase [Caldilineaceae bacterium]